MSRRPKPIVEPPIRRFDREGPGLIRGVGFALLVSTALAFVAWSARTHVQARDGVTDALDRVRRLGALVEESACECDHSRCGKWAIEPEPLPAKRGLVR